MTAVIHAVPLPNHDDEVARLGAVRRYEILGTPRPVTEADLATLATLATLGVLNRDRDRDGYRAPGRVPRWRQ